MQLISVAHVLAVTQETEVTANIIQEATELFLDSRRAAEMVAQGEGYLV